MAVIRYFLQQTFIVYQVQRLTYVQFILLILQSSRGFMFKEIIFQSEIQFHKVNWKLYDNMFEFVVWEFP